MSLKSALPGEELFLRQLVGMANFLDGHPAAEHRGDHCGLATNYPSAGIRRW
jgi:hypothetical protein